MRKLFHSVGTGFQYRLWIKTKVTIGNGDTTEGSVDRVFGSNPVKGGNGRVLFPRNTQLAIGAQPEQTPIIGSPP